MNKAIILLIIEHSVSHRFDHFLYLRRVTIQLNTHTITMNKRYLLTLLLSCLSLLVWADRIDQQIAQEIAQTVTMSYQESSLRTSTQSRMPNAPTDALYLSSTGELMTDTDDPSNPALPPITLKENKLTDCYLNVASELNDDLYNAAKKISFDMSGQSGDKTMRFQIQDYDHWRGHLCVWYKNEMFYESKYGTKLTIGDDGVFTIPVLASEIKEDSYSTYLLVGSDLGGTLQYDMEILDNSTGSSQYSMNDGTIYFIQKLATQISPSPIKGPAETAIPAAVTLSNIDPMLYGKSVYVILVVSPILNQNIQIQYKGTTINGISDGPNLIFPISEALPAASSLEIPFTLQSDKEILSGDRVTLSCYVSGFQGAWGYSPVVITPAEPKNYSIQSSLTGLSLATESETVLQGGTYEGVLSVTDADHTKLPQQITVKVANSEDTWNDFGYDPRTGNVIIRNVTTGLVIQAAAEPFQSYTITPQLQNVNITGLPEGNTIQEGHSLSFTLSAHENYRLPATIQVKQNGEALSTEAYTYNSTSGLVEIPSVQGNITIVASAIGEDCHEVLLQLTNLTSTLETTSFLNNSQVTFVLNANSGYTRPAALTVTLGETTLIAGEGYAYDPTNGSFTLSAITGTLTIIGAADPKDYGEATFALTHLTVGADHTEKAIHGKIYECQLTADEGYDLPNAVQIKMNGTPLRAGYTYENGLIQIESVTGPVTITAAATPKTYSFTTQLDNLTCEWSPYKVKHGDLLTVYFTAAEGYSLPPSVSVKMNGTTLTGGYFYVDGVLRIFPTGPVEITASAIFVITDSEKEVEGTISEVHVETMGSTSLALQALNTDLMEISSNSDAHLMVATNSRIEELNNHGTTTLSSDNGAQLTIETILNSGVLVFDESLRLANVPGTITNNGSFKDFTSMVKEVDGPAALKISMPLPAQSSYPQGETHSLTVKVLVATERDKTIFEWKKKENDLWQTVKTDSQKVSSLRSDGLIEQTSTYDLPLNESGAYRCVVTNFKSDEIQTTLVTETSVTVNAPAPEPIILYRVTIPQIEGATVLTYGSMYVEEWEDFSFRIQIQEGYDATNMSVEANGTVLLPDASGLYTIEHITDNVTVTITGIVKETPTSIGTIGADTTAVWTSRGQIHIRLNQEATVTVLSFSGRLVKLFKGAAGNYAIPVQAGSYIVTIDDMVYKVAL